MRPLQPSRLGVQCIIYAFIGDLYAAVDALSIDLEQNVHPVPCPLGNVRGSDSGI